MPTLKKLLSLPIIIAICMLARIDSSYAAGNCDIPSLDTMTDGDDGGYQNDSTGAYGPDSYQTSNYGITTDNTWAAEFSYGTVWGMAKCSETSGNYSDFTWPESSKSDWLKTPSDTTGQYCWCQVTGFTASGNSYTSGPQCTTTASSLWVFFYDSGLSDYCADDCASLCAVGVQNVAASRAGLFGVAGYVPPSVGLTWYDNGTAMSGGPSSCTVGGTFLPPTPPARPGYIFTGWKIKKETCGVNNLDTSIGGIIVDNGFFPIPLNGYTRLNGSAGSNESNYGLTTGSGQWAAEFDYGTVWGMAKCSETSGNNSSYTWPESSKSDWLKTPSDTTGQYCWCQATGFTASGNSYTSGPQCTTTASSLWVFRDGYGSSNACANICASNCARDVQTNAAFRAGLFGSVGQ